MILKIFRYATIVLIITGALFPNTSFSQGLFNRNKEEKTLSSDKGKSGGKLKKGFSLFKKSKENPGILNGEIVASYRRGWNQPTPYGMVLVPAGSFLMGQADEDFSNSVVNLNRRVSVSSFFMDDTEITNHEYRQFTESLLRDSLAVLGETKIMEDYYPDSTVWVNDYAYHNGDPMLEYYFSSPSYDTYPVVGVSWKAAKYFCQWRSNMMNEYRRSEGLFVLPRFELPTEAEWEWAARGGKASAKYPWGNPYIANAKGCLLANFKPQRGNYISDGYMYTAPANAYNPNDFGLYNMAGNVAEWCKDAYAENSNAITWDLNSYYYDENEPRKIVRGGSWKDISYYLQTGTRTYEYQDKKRAYIGFRTVMRYLGTKK